MMPIGNMTEQTGSSPQRLSMNGVTRIGRLVACRL